MTSVLSQESCEYALIVVDDGSMDQTKGVLERYSDRLQYVYQNNSGVSLARNHGIQPANGQYIAFLDADDVFFPGKLAAQHQCFEKGLADDANLGIVHSGWNRVDTQEQILMEVKPWEQTPDLTLETWLKYKPVLPSAIMFRKDCWNR